MAVNLPAGGSMWRVPVVFLLAVSLRACAQDLTPPSDRCDLRPGMADAYVLALSWQPGFCETYGHGAGKKECLELSARGHAANHLVLHGLWPNQEACGIDYTFCGADMQTHHCDYARLPLNDATAQLLSVNMPSFSAGTCLERHEWYKHGSCQDSNVNDYFTRAAHFAEAVDATPIGVFLRQNRGRTVKAADFADAVDASFGKAYRSRVFIGCTSGVLVDVWLSLPMDTSSSKSLSEMVQEAPPFKRPSTCPSRFRISAFAPAPLAQTRNIL
ncbi:ribonuclease T [Legionella geestiana]|nr:ribonuclease T [Legionella geestiana]